MLPERFFIGQPVRSLQMMLREISYHYDFLPRLIPDGIYEEETARVVTIFQQNFGLIPTGVVDNDTWDAVVVIFRRVTDLTHRPLPANLFPASDYKVRPGEQRLHIMVVQSMFKALSRILDGPIDLPVDGSHTGPSVHNVKWLQRRGGLPETGIMDMQTWDLLARLYALFLTRNPKLK